MYSRLLRLALPILLLVALSLSLFGCSGAGLTNEQAQAVMKELSGVVSDSSTGQPFANAQITAYGVDASGNQLAKPLGATVNSDGLGNFKLNIPDSYTGTVIVRAVQNGVTTLRTAVPSDAIAKPVYVGLASEMVARYIEQNNAGAFTVDNIKTSQLVLEPYFGQNFSATPPPQIGAAPTAPQQQQLVMTRSLDQIVTAPGGTTLTNLVTIPSGSTAINLSQPANMNTLNTALSTVSTTLVNAGGLPGSFTPPTITPLTTIPDITDTTPPTVPQAVASTTTDSSVNLSWSAATDTTGVTSYLIFRNGSYLGSVPSNILAFADTSAVSGQTYSYAIKARDAAGNLSSAGTINAGIPAVKTYSISGKITSGSTALASVYIAVSGSGSGIAITDADGNYTITAVRTGAYTLKPVLAGYSFTPSFKEVTVSSSDLTSVDFTAEVNGSITGGISYPTGTIVGGISYPSGAIIGGITYPTGTVVGGIVYPTGTVIGGVTYPAGVLIGGVSYPAGTVVGGVAFPVGTIIGAVSYPSGGLTAQLDWNSINYINGAVTFNSVGLPNVTLNVQKDGQAYIVAATDSIGNFSIPLPQGDYVITPSLTGYSFAPAATSTISITSDGTVVTGQNFNATQP